LNILKHKFIAALFVLSFLTGGSRVFADNGRPIEVRPGKVAGEFVNVILVGPDGQELAEQDPDERAFDGPVPRERETLSPEPESLSSLSSGAEIAETAEIAEIEETLVSVPPEPSEPASSSGPASGAEIAEIAETAEIEETLASASPSEPEKHLLSGAKAEVREAFASEGTVSPGVSAAPGSASNESRFAGVKAFFRGLSRTEIGLIVSAIVLILLAVIITVRIRRTRARLKQARIEQEAAAARAAAERAAAAAAAAARATEVVEEPVAPPKPRGVNLFLTTLGTTNVRRYTVNVPDRIEVGRWEECQFVITDDPSISSRHCELLWHSGTLSVRDLGSTNGTALNGVPIKGVQALVPGDVIELGHTRLRLSEIVRL
jgi:hypothetical protein